ncbi:hypothetical protein HKD37_16G046400 [Glycine soja]
MLLSCLQLAFAFLLNAIEIKGNSVLSSIYPRPASPNTSHLLHRNPKSETNLTPLCHGTRKHSRLHDPAILLSDESVQGEELRGLPLVKNHTIRLAIAFKHNSSPIQRFSNDSGTKTRQPPIRIGGSWNRIKSCLTCTSDSFTSQVFLCGISNFIRTNQTAKQGILIDSIWLK